MPAEHLVLRSDAPAATRAIARSIGVRLRGGEALALAGPLGAGKTLFAKGLAEGLAIDPREVTSPTFLLIHEIPGRLDFCHVDAYRLTGPDELLELGAGDLFRPGAVVVVEWPERAPGFLPADHLRVEFLPTGPGSRELRLLAGGPRHAALLAGLRDGGGVPS